MGECPVVVIFAADVALGGGEEVGMRGPEPGLPDEDKDDAVVVVPVGEATRLPMAMLELPGAEGVGIAADPVRRGPSELGSAEEEALKSS